MTGHKQTVNCALCGVAVTEQEADRAGWMTQIEEGRGMLRICEACARSHLRSIEARLDRDWW